MELSNWQKQVEAKLAEHEEAGLETKDLKFFHVDTLLHYAGHCERFSPKCKHCRSYMKVIEKTAENLDKYLGGSPKGRSEYEKIFFEIENHLKKEHGLVKPKFQLSLFTFSGMVGGTLFGVVLSQFINPNAMDKFILGGWFLGLLAGRIMGNRKENELKSQGRYL